MPPSGKSKKNKMLASYNKIWPANRGPHNKLLFVNKKSLLLHIRKDTLQKACSI